MADQEIPGVEQLQAAALTAIHAGQAFLNAAEQLVANPESAAQLIAMLTTLAKAAMATVVPASPSPSGSSSRPMPSSAASETGDAASAGADAVQSIDVR